MDNVPQLSANVKSMSNEFLSNSSNTYDRSTNIDSVDKNIVSEQPFLIASMYILKQKIAEPGLSAKAQEEVLARACENCDKNTTQGSLPAIGIKEMTPTVQATSLDH